MVGKHNSVLSRVKEKQPHVYSQGCVCHLANLALLAGVKALPVDINDFFVDLFYYFDKSVKRKEDLHEFQLFTDTKPLKILKHCKTRWPSLEKAVYQVIQQWPALYAYFDSVSENDHSGRVKRLDQNFKSHLTKLVMLFLEFALDSMCKFFQSRVATLPILKPEVQRLVRILLGRFVQAEAIQGANNDFTDINFQDPLLHLPDDQLGIGHEAWSYVSSEEDALDPSVQRLFFNGVRDFYVAVASTLIRKFPFTDTLADDVAIFLSKSKGSVTWNQVCRLAQRFTAAVPQQHIDALEEEMLDYKLAPVSSLPSCELNHDGVASSSAVVMELCSYWDEIGRTKTLDGKPRFPYLASLAKCVLSLPVSNADTERVFSNVRKILTDCRTEMDADTLCALLSCKINSNCDCFELHTSLDLLRKAKRATMDYNRQHSTKI